MLKIIPGTKGFTVDEVGNVYDPDGNPRNVYRNGDGYKTVSVKLLDDRWVTFGIHRLVALAHLGELQDFGRSEVNHRDSDIENNWVSNLEWVSSSENNIHSEIMRKDNFYTTLIATSGEMQKLYRNAHEAAEDLGVQAVDVWDGVKNGTLVNGWEFAHRPYSGALPEAVRRSTGMFKGMGKRLEPRPIKMLDTNTGDILEYSSIGLAASTHEVSPSHIYQSIGVPGRPRLFKKKYLVAYLADDFIEMSAEQLEIAKQHGPREVIAYDRSVSEYVIFPSAKEFIAESGLSKKAVTAALAKNKIRDFGNWVALYFNQTNAELLKVYVESPVST